MKKPLESQPLREVPPRIRRVQEAYEENLRSERVEVYLEDPETEDSTRVEDAIYYPPDTDEPSR